MPAPPQAAAAPTAEAATRSTVAAIREVAGLGMRTRLYRHASMSPSPPISADTLEDLAWPQILEHLAERCHTARGSAAARTLELFSAPDEARRRIAAVAEARLLHDLGEPMPFGGIEDVGEALGRVERGGVLEGPELAAVGKTVAGCAALRRHLMARAAATPLLAEEASGIAPLEHVSGPILDSFDPDGRLADHASAALGPLRRKVAELHAELGRRARALLDDAGIAPHLQDRFYTQREDRYVVPIRAEARARVRGIVHGSSQSGHTVFVEPEAIVELNNRLKLAETDVAEEERRILAELSSYVRAEAPAIRAALDAATRLDVLDAAALLAEAQGAIAPEIDEEGRLELRAARHPLMALAGKMVVPNDLVLAPGTFLIISGPNAGGKTVALKTAGVAALLVRAGLHVPAAAPSRVPWFDAILTDIGDDQSLERDLSTFSAHLLAMRRFLETAGPRTLILVDELAVGTDPDQGAALGQALLEALAARGAQGIVTTHFEQLKALGARDPRFVNASVGYDLERMVPTFRLHLGVPGSSGALALARRLGLPREIVDEAEALLGGRRASIDELLSALAQERRRLEAEWESAAQARRRAEAAQREAEAARHAFEEKTRRLHEQAHDEALEALRQARDELDRLKRALRGKGAAFDVHEAKEKLHALRSEIAGYAPPPAEVGGAPARAENLRPGVRVLLPKLGSRGEVVEPPRDGRVVVQVGRLRSTVPMTDVRLDTGPATPAARPEARAGVFHGQAPRARTPKPAGVTFASRPAAPSAKPADEGGERLRDDYAPVRTASNTVDVRGARVDEALAQIDRFLDAALLVGEESVLVIHGHGTGALRNAVREHLALHPGIRRFRPGRPEEGGDGVTVAWLE